MDCIKWGAYSSRALSYLLLPLILLLTGCPAKDWIKRDDAYLTVEQYKIMTEVISVNDTLYRVKKGEEINQNKITQLFVNLQHYKNASKKEQMKMRKLIKKTYRSEKTTFNLLTYSLILLERKGHERRVQKLLSNVARNGLNADEKDLVNLAHILLYTLKSSAALKKQNAKLMRENSLIKEEVSYLNKQINALKSIEESIHAREAGAE